MSLKGKTAVVTGSTSGIGHAIAMALAKDGCNIVVNGLGTEKDNEKADRRGQEARHARRLRSGQHAAPQSDRRHDRQGRARLRLGRHPGQQRRHPARRAGRGVPHRAVGRHHRHQPHLGLPHRAGGGARHEEAQVGAHHQHLLGAFAARLALQERLRVGQARPRRLHQDGGARACRARRDVERHLAGVRVDAAGREADPRSRQVGEHHRGRRPSGRCCRASRPTSSSRSSRSPRSRRSSPAKPQPRSPAPTTRSMAAGPRSSAD